MNRCIERARGGDISAAQTLVNILTPRIEKMARYYARCCGDDPDDLLQEAWIGVLKALSVVDLGIGIPEQFLIKHARWSILDAVKRSKRSGAIQGFEHMTDAIPGAASDECHSESVTREFVSRLTGIQRDIVVCLLEGMTWRETGDMLGCSSANVAYHMKQIRKQYERWSSEDIEQIPAGFAESGRSRLADRTCAAI
ncbi:MAG: sigma-70 family RNA polymerase sigma factor [Armatimonadota bacterium]